MYLKDISRQQVLLASKIKIFMPDYSNICHFFLGISDTCCIISLCTGYGTDMANTEGNSANMYCYTGLKYSKNGY